MNTLLQWLTAPGWVLVVKALLHSLWEGALVALVLAIVLRRVGNPAVRYRLALAGMVVVVGATLVTWGILNSPRSSQLGAAPAGAADAPVIGSAGPVKTIVVVAVQTSPPPSLQWTTWLALAWVVGASVMLGRASVKVAGAEQLRRASRPLQDEVVDALIREVKAAVNLTRRVRVAVTDRLTSPAVVGVLEPTLILPLALITTFSPEQLRFILLHELAHIRRGDYLTNLFQLFAEALFFFNPAVWWLSHQVRREREACCDALAIELSGAPADYARTLVSVAETMLNPVLVAAPAFGNEREPSSLADRVHRAMVPGYRPSLRLTWRAMLTALVLGVGLLGLLAMGARETVAATTSLLGTNQLTEATGSDTAQRPERATDSQPLRAHTDRQNIFGKLKNIRLPRVEFDGVSLAKVIRFLNETTRQSDPAGQGVKFTLAEGAKPAAGARVDPATGLPLEQPGGGAIDPTTGLPSTSGMAGGSSPGSAVITVTPARNDISLQAALDAIVRGSSVPIKYSILEDGVCFSAAAAKGAPQLYVRTFKVDTNALALALGRVGPEAKVNPSVALHELFSKLGVDFQPPKTLFYNERQGLVIVRATQADLDIIEQVAQLLNQTPPQVNIRARFVEVPEDVWARRGLGFLATSNRVASFTAVILPKQAVELLELLDRENGVRNLSSPSITTLSGRQAQLAMGTFGIAAARINPMALTPPGILITNGNDLSLYLTDTNSIKDGLTLDVIPSVSADGQTIELATTTTFNSFIGYDEPTNFVTIYTNGIAGKLGVPLPNQLKNQIKSTAVVADGQTMVLGGALSAEDHTASKVKRTGKMQLLVFVTPTIIDPAGNRVHPDK